MRLIRKNVERVAVTEAQIEKLKAQGFRGKAKALRIMGVILIVLSVVSLITHFSSGLAAVISCIIDLIISIIYFAGAQKNLKTL